MTDDRPRHTTTFLLESWLELSDVIDDHPEVKDLLFDPVTGLPTTPLLFPRIRMLLEERGEVSLLAINIVKYSKIEEIFGWRVFDDVMREAANALESIAGSVIRDSDIVAELMVSGNAFVVVLSPPRDTLHMDPDSRQMIVHKVEKSIRESLAERIEPAIYRMFGCYAGAATVVMDPNIRLERLVHRGLDLALGDSGSREAADAVEREQRLREIIAEENVTTLVHPIFDLEDFSVIGYEALSRGPADTEFERPDKLFRVAYDADLVLRLERLCRKKALEAATNLPPDKMLFLNIEPEAVADPELREIMTSTILSQSSVTPDRIVLEITEHAAVADFVTFRSTLEYLRALGFSMAIDDAGAGYGSIQCLSETNPAWMKIDMCLIRDIDHDDIRVHMVDNIVRYAAGRDVKLVAEGIETREELLELKRLGIRYGQGFLFGQPVEPFPADSEFDSLRESL